jgi:hypothetical protein
VLSVTEAQAQDGELVELSNHESGNYNELDTRLSLAKLVIMVSLSNQSKFDHRNSSIDVRFVTVKRASIFNGLKG